MSDSNANVPSAVLQNMYDHALAEKAVWEGSRKEHTVRLASAVQMVAHWDEQIAGIGASLAARGEFSDDAEGDKP